MKKKIALFMAAAMFAPSAFAAEITPYVGLGLVIDKASTSARRVGFDPSKINPSDPMSSMTNAIIVNGGGNMDFDMAFAGEITAGVKYGNVRAEVEVAVRSASEDDYDIFNGNINLPSSALDPSLGTFLPNGINIPLELENSISVRHNSYLVNMYYDFELSNSNWTPYIGAGVGFGVYHQKAVVDIDIDEEMLMAGVMAGLGDMAAMPGVSDQVAKGMAPVLAEMRKAEGERTVADDTLYRFEWQVGLGAVYNFNEDWAMDIGYRFNSSTVGGEFVYAHEVKLGARYSF